MESLPEDWVYLLPFGETDAIDLSGRKLYGEMERTDGTSYGSYDILDGNGRKSRIDRLDPEGPKIRAAKRGTITMRGAVFAGDGRIEVRDLAEPKARNSDDVVISVAANGICGSDLRALTTPPQMIYEQGVVIGHEFVGEVSEVGSGVVGTEVGQRVTAVPNINCQTCWYCRSGHLNLCENFVHIGSMRNGGAAGYVVVPERMVVPVPDSLSDKMATLVEPLACVLNGTRTAAVHPGETVVILGAGAIGMLYAMIFRSAGAQVIVSEPGEQRAQMADDLGLGIVVSPLEQDIGEVVRNATDGRGADVCVDSVGMLLGDAISYARKGGRVMMFGLNDLARADLSISDIVYRELHLHGVYIGKGTFPLAIELLDRNEIGFDRLLTHSFELEDSASAIDAARSGEAVKAVILPG